MNLDYKVKVLKVSKRAHDFKLETWNSMHQLGHNLGCIISFVVFEIIACNFGTGYYLFFWKPHHWTKQIAFRWFLIYFVVGVYNHFWKQGPQWGSKNYHGIFWLLSDIFLFTVGVGKTQTRQKARYIPPIQSNEDTTASSSASGPSWRRWRGGGEEGGRGGPWKGGGGESWQATVKDAAKSMRVRSEEPLFLAVAHLYGQAEVTILWSSRCPKQRFWTSFCRSRKAKNDYRSSM